MSLRSSILRKATSPLVRPQPIAYSAARTYASSYPFTKGESAEESGKAVPNPRSTSKSLYPFTRPAESQQGASPTRPVDRPGSDGQDFDSVPSMVTQQESTRAHNPDYNVSADYRTS